MAAKKKNKIQKYIKKVTNPPKKTPVQKKESKKIQKEHWALTFFISGIFSAVLLLVIIIMYFILKQFFNTNLLNEYNKTDLDTSLVLFIVIMSTLVLSYGLSLLISKSFTNPVSRLINTLEKLASGNYKERLHFKKPYNNTKTFLDLSDSVNKLAEELEHTETLSTDFINNFSHEFKTPIVSIAGFAKLLQSGNLTQEQQNEYLAIIAEESTRLSNLTKGVLEMVKIDNQSILTNVTQFNLSEQIRKCILLLEDKWSNADIDLQLNFDEFYIHGNEELLKHVWINLLDNAIKFTPPKNIISITIKRKGRKLAVAIANTGITISSENQKHIFNKFFQADKSHSSQGNGIGLAVVKKVVTLHKGNVDIISGNNKTIFTVTLPE